MSFPAEEEKIIIKEREAVLWHLGFQTLDSSTLIFKKLILGNYIILHC